MSTLNELRPGTYRPGMGAFGIEIETESKSAYNSPEFHYWTVHGDGSLRDYGVEYVLHKPLEYNEVPKALLEFKDKTKGIKFNEKSTYTSVHVHLNFVDKDLKVLANFITLYLLVENVLTRYCGSDRDGNLFCLKVADAEDQLQQIRSLFNGVASGNLKTAQRVISNLNANAYKYSALNICPLRNFGSVEVRTHYGTTDIDLIDRWVSILNRLYEAAQKYSDPTEIVKQLYKRSSFIPFVNHLFGDYAKYFDENTIDNDVHRNLFYVKTLLYEVKSWKKFGVFTNDSMKVGTVTISATTLQDAGFPTTFYLNTGNTVWVNEAMEDI